MKQKTLQWISLTATAAILAAGCAAGPQRAPNRMNRTLPPTNVSSTTGDTDSCAVALGNRVVGMTTTRTGTNDGEATANGVLIGNVALVALPTATATGTQGTGITTDTRTGTPATGTPATGMTTTPGTPGTGTTATGAPAPGTAATGAPGAPAVGGRAAGTTATGAAASGVGAAGQGVAGAVRRLTNTAPATPVTPTTPTAPATPVTPTAPTAPTAPTTPAAGAPGATMTSPQTAAVDRIKRACDQVADIRVVNTAADRQRLSEITYAIRNGHPITEFMTDLNRMSQAATSVGAGRNANRGPGIAPSPTAAR